jgi:alginate O-acetyltransferase complex protein AlgI
MQIYFDFSGYSDMAVGLGLMFGFRLPQNFNSPYKAESITDFWRRWHISLSTWLRDYLYIPLGGNRRGGGRTYLNLLITMLLGGLWHGANWTFVLWGGYHGTLLALERMVGKRSLLWWAPLGIRRGGTFLLVMLGWIIFRAGDLGAVGSMCRGLAGWNGMEAGFGGVLSRNPLPYVLLGVTMLGAFLLPNTWDVKWKQGLVLAIGLVLLFVLCVMVIMVNTSSPFLYFQF